jgi:hypothetical protein
MAVRPKPASKPAAIARRLSLKAFIDQSVGAPSVGMCGRYGRRVRLRVLRYERAGIVVKPRLGPPFSIAYGEILTAERLPRRGIRLHTRTADPIRVVARGSSLVEVEGRLRASGVRVVDRWGCLLTPTLADFEDALDQEPVTVRQSSDNA